jgi:hypothetical protein
MPDDRTVRSEQQDHPFFRAMREQILQAPEPRHRRLSTLLSPGQRWRRSPLRVAGASAGLVAILIGLIVSLSTGDVASPAYAVTINSNRSVTIYLREFRDIGRLNARLAFLHTGIRAVPVMPGCVAPVHSFSDAYGKGFKKLLPGPPETLEALPATRGIILSYETLSTDTLPGRTFIIPVSRSGLQTGFRPPDGNVVLGTAPRCVGEVPPTSASPSLPNRPRSALFAHKS